MEPSARSLRIAFLDSWMTQPAEGSGTATGISALASGLRELGHSVELLRPAVGRGPHLLRRLHFNRTLPARLDRAGPFDPVVGFDIDGFGLRRDQESRPPFVLALKGIAADEARFATSTHERVLLRFLARLERDNASRAGVVVVPSRYSARTAHRFYGVPDERIAVVPEAVDPAPFLALPRRAREKSRTILSVARQYPRKDTATLLRAMPQLVRTDPEIRLRVVGGGPELPRLRALVSDLELSSAVTLTGPLPHFSQLLDEYARASIFCLPSLQEGFGIVFVEAMAAGLPVVAAHAGAAPEVIEEGRTGLLVPPRDSTALARALRRLVEAPEARERMGEEGRRCSRSYEPRSVALSFLRAVGRAPGIPSPSPPRTRAST